MVYKCAFITVSLFLMVMGRPQEPVDNALPSLPPQSGSAVSPIPIINQAESIDPAGNFNYSYETGNGIKFEEAGVLKHVTGLRARGNFAADDKTPDEDDILVQTGSFSYTAPDGTVISLRYIADENGFQPVGDHLPTPPPIPASILRALSRSDDKSQPQQQPQHQQPQQQPPQEQPQEQPQQEVQQEPAEAPLNADIITP